MLIWFNIAGRQLPACIPAGRPLHVDTVALARVLSQNLAFPLSASFHHNSVLTHLPIAAAIQRETPTVLSSRNKKALCQAKGTEQLYCNTTASRVRSSCSVRLDQENRNNLQTLSVCLPVKYWGSGMWGAWTGSSWLRIGTGSGRLWMR
jgi:hypothetical protein